MYTLTIAIVFFILQQIKRQNRDRGMASKKPKKTLTLVFGNQTLPSGD